MTGPNSSTFASSGAHSSMRLLSLRKLTLSGLILWMNLRRLVRPMSSRITLIVNWAVRNYVYFETGTVWVLSYVVDGGSVPKPSSTLNWLTLKTTTWLVDSRWKPIQDFPLCCLMLGSTNVGELTSSAEFFHLSVMTLTWRGVQRLAETRLSHNRATSLKTSRPGSR